MFGFRRSIASVRSYTLPRPLHGLDMLLVIINPHLHVRIPMRADLISFEHLPPPVCTSFRAHHFLLAALQMDVLCQFCGSFADSGNQSMASSITP